MWHGNEKTPQLCNCQRYQCSHGTCNNPGISCRIRDRSRSRSPLRNTRHPSCTATENGAPHPEGLAGIPDPNLGYKKKCDELRKRHKREREAWTKEKEALLKEVLELKAGENRGTLLELKAVLEVIQREQRREEKKWTDFLLQFLNDRCGWEIERLELKQYISKLEANPAKICGNKSTPDILTDVTEEKIERRRLLEDTHAVAMELRKQLENNEQNWKVEKMELLERFDNERKEWEGQWKMMQSKIEELYQEVKLRREKTLSGDEGDIEQMLQLSMPFPQTELSKPMITERHENSVPTTGLDKKSTILPNDCSNKENKTNCRITEKKKDVSKAESEKWLAQRMSKTENDTLNDALKEIARVSEELCKYQEEIRTRSTCKRTVPDTRDGDSKKKLHINLERNHGLSSKTSRLKQKDIISNSSKPSQASLPILAHNPRTDLLTAQDLDFSWNFSLDLTHSVFPDLNMKPVIQMASKGKASDLSLENYTQRLCHVGEWCDIGGLDEINFTESLFSHLTDVSSLTPEMNEQNVSVSQNGHVNSIDLYPMRLEHSTLGHGYVNTIKNGKLAAKIDEFNRAVFKTGQGNTVLDDPVVMAPAIEVQPSDDLIICENPSTEKAIKQTLMILEASEQACANGSFHHSIKTSKANAPQSQPAASQNMSSYPNVLHEHNWKRINLSGRPRSADSRSNYGVVEKLLKSYETKTAASFGHSKQSISKWSQSDFLVADNNNETLSQCLEQLHLDKTSKDFQSDIYWQSRQDTMSLKLPEVSLTKLTNGKGFSRPARPANRRPPSRWASTRSPSMPPVVRRATH